MIDHFEIKAQSFSECIAFYRTVLPALGIELKWSDAGAAGFGAKTDTERVLFLVEKSDRTASMHLAFEAPNQESVRLFHQLGIDHGYLCNGPPGFRDTYSPGYFAAFLRDPDGNNIEAVIRLSTPQP